MDTTKIEKAEDHKEKRRDPFIAPTKYEAIFSLHGSTCIGKLDTGVLPQRYLNFYGEEKQVQCPQTEKTIHNSLHLEHYRRLHIPNTTANDEYLYKSKNNDILLRNAMVSAMFHFR